MDTTTPVALPSLKAELLLAAIGMRRVLEPGPLKILVRDQEEAAALQRRIESFWRGFFASDDLERADPLPEGFSWPFLREALAEDATDLATEDNVQGFSELEDGALFGALTLRLRELLRREAPIRTRQVGTGLEPVEPSDHDLARFRRVWHVVDDPMRVLKDTASGIVSAKQVATLREAYPALAEAMTDVAFRALAARVADSASYRIPWHKDVPMRRFLGSWRWSPALVVRLQDALQKAKAQPEATAMPRPLPMRPEALATPVERVTGR